MEQEIYVYVDLDGSPVLAGRLWSRTSRGKETATFQYDPAWLENPAKFSLEPALALDPSPFHATPEAPLFGAIGDSAPDRWGRALMRRAERQRAEQERQQPRTLREIDYLLNVDDAARQGALRFAEKTGGPFLRAEGAKRIPPLLELPDLLSAAQRVSDDSETAEDLRLLVAPGSSLGGARPKASVIDRDGSLAIAKFPKKDDEWNTVAWEAVALTLARNAGIQVPGFRVEDVSDMRVLLVTRFDRDGRRRIPFLSAMSMLQAKDNQARSYLEIVDALRKHGSSFRDDARELWRRIVFNILISNTDDHLRNHAFLYGGPHGWRLSPAYDLNPMPADVKRRVLSTAINEDDGTATLSLAMSVASYFQLDPDEARHVAAEVGNAVAGWRKVAGSFGLGSREIDRLASAFEHGEIERAIA